MNGARRDGIAEAGNKPPDPGTAELHVTRNTFLLSGLLGATLALLGGVVLAAIGLVGRGVAGLLLSTIPILLIPRSSPKTAWLA